MATSFKGLTGKDTTTTKTLLHESLPITGSLLSGTYAGGLESAANVRTFSHGMFQSYYDYPYLSSSANHVFDITVGISSGSGADTYTQNAKKVNIYSQMAQVLMGHDATGSIQRFDEDGDIIAGGTKLDQCVFINFSRLLTKDEIKKESVSLQFLTGGFGTGSQQTGLVTIVDASASTNYRVNSPAGEYGILYDQYTTTKKGLIFYQAGVAVLTASVFTNLSCAADAHGTRNSTSQKASNASDFNIHSANDVLTGSTIDQAVTSIRQRIYNLQFNNTTELNSSIYFCRANHNEFNYSSNPTYLTGSKIRVKETAQDRPSSYITTVGLYSADNQLLAVAKLSEPLKKTPETELTLKVRLDY